ncbi:hypothetical protein [Amycolatopsis sp. H20-H5]|uniref:hypothetical protein n=1 Tax=Amycolatopsis sp. H20-H5 TaxID=3046309 RepID=UPI002DBE8E14|nr:hypothetical protein [Amycolatopsis sp. H20-H5]MEC3978144.1 hypothetical protein [Amycolatopsis sp. H20-H5]
MQHTTRNVLGEAAFLRRGCDILIDQLREIERLVDGTEELTPIQEAAVATADAHPEGAKEHLELAGRYIAVWKKALEGGLTTEPSWLP